MCILAATAALSAAFGQGETRAELDRRFTRTVRPFLENYCLSCHGQREPAAQLDLSRFTTMAGLLQDGHRAS